MDGQPLSSASKPSVALWLSELRVTLRTFPWRDTAATLTERFREDRLGLTASSLTFTTTVSLVPLITLALALFTAFPMFAKLQGSLERWLIDSLMPDSIARQVSAYITQFAAKASRLGMVGLLLVLASGLALMLTIDKALNQIWRVRRPRPLAQRILVYWGAITLGPLILGVSLTATTWALTSQFGVGGSGKAAAQIPTWVRWLLDAIQFGLVALGTAALYHHVPNTAVRWAHALAGGFFVAMGLELAQRLLAMYLKAVPSFSAIYGTFATVPILLVWIYVMWVLVLLGAVIAAYLPSLTTRIRRRPKAAGGAFVQALEVLYALKVNHGGQGTSTARLSKALRIDPLALQTSLQTLAEMGWVGELAAPHEGRWVLLIDPAQTPIEPLSAALLLRDEALAARLLVQPKLDDMLAITAAKWAPILGKKSDSAADE